MRATPSSIDACGGCGASAAPLKPVDLLRLFPSPSGNRRRVCCPPAFHALQAPLDDLRLASGASMDSPAWWILFWVLVRASVSCRTRPAPPPIAPTPAGCAARWPGMEAHLMLFSRRRVLGPEHHLILRSRCPCRPRSLRHTSSVPEYHRKIRGRRRMDEVVAARWAAFNISFRNPPPLFQCRGRCRILGFQQFVVGLVGNPHRRAVG